MTTIRKKKTKNKTKHVLLLLLMPSPLPRSAAAADRRRRLLLLQPLIRLCIGSIESAAELDSRDHRRRQRFEERQTRRPIHWMMMCH